MAPASLNDQRLAPKQCGFDFIDSDNILFSNLARDGLHINTGGARKFAINLSRYIKYCQWCRSADNAKSEAKPKVKATKKGMASRSQLLT